MILPTDGHTTRKAFDKATKALQKQREARQLAEGIPAAWDRTKAGRYRTFRDNRAARGLPFVDALAWDTKDYQRPRDTRRKRPAGWTAEDWRAYTTAQNYRREANLEPQDPDTWMANSRRHTPKKREPKLLPRNERAPAAVARILETVARMHPKQEHTR